MDLGRTTTEPQQIGPYRVEKKMGEGGMATVYQGVDTRSGQAVALKVARSTDRNHRTFLRGEIGLLERLGRTGNPGIVRLLESGSTGPILWYAMALVPGVDLAVLGAELRRRTQVVVGGHHLRATEAPGVTGASYPQAVRSSKAEEVFDALFSAPIPDVPIRDWRLPVLVLVAKLSRTLAFLHEQGIVHGDLTPANVIVGTDGLPVLVDFGTARCSFVDGVSREEACADGLRYGTPAYTAPERTMGAPLDARSDLYSLGCILFELVAGQPPFVADAPDKLRLQHLNLVPRRLSSVAVGVGPGLDELVGQLLEKDPERRIGYAEDVAIRLEQIAGMGSPSTGLCSVVRRQLYRSQLVGREHELAILLGHVEHAMASRGRIVLVGGESGVGKTRLVNDLGNHAATRSCAVVVGQCTAALGESGAVPRAASAPLQPFLPFLRLIADVLVGEPDIRKELRHELQTAVVPLVTFEPALGAIPEFGEIAQPSLPTAMARDRIMRALEHCIRSFAAIRPLLLLIDDLQWADELTLEFFTSRHAQGLASASVAIVATYRQEEISLGFIDHWRKAGGEVLELPRLHRDQLFLMVKGMIASSLLPEELGETLYRYSEGNPFLAAEYLRSALETGYLFRTPEGRWAAAVDAGRRLDAATAIPMLGNLQLRLFSLSPTTRMLAELGALLGREFHAGMLGRLAGLEESSTQVRQRLDDLVVRRVLDETSPGHYRFVHDKLREGLEHMLPADRRSTLHRAAALGLQETSEEVSRPPSQDAAIGRHWAEAGESALASMLLERAAQGFERMHAVGEAIDSYDTAFREAQKLPSPGGPPAQSHARQAQLAEAAGDLLVRVARHQAARERYTWALGRTDENDLLTRGRLQRKRGRSFWQVHQYDDACALLTEAQELLGRVAGADPVVLERELIEVYQNLFWTNYFARQIGPDAEELVCKLSAATTRNGTVRQRAMYHQCAACLEMAQTRYRPTPSGIEHARRALTLLEGTPELSMEAGEARFELAFALVLGDREECREAASLLDSSAQTAARTDDMTNRARSLAYLTIALRRLGEIEQTRVAAERAFAAAETAGLLPYLGVARSCLAWVALRTADVIRTRVLVDDARSWWNRAGHAFPFRWLDGLVLLELQTADGDIASARTTVADLLAPDQQQLPAPIDTAMKRVHALALDAPLRGAHEALTAVLFEARRSGFV